MIPVLNDVLRSHACVRSLVVVLGLLQAGCIVTTHSAFGQFVRGRAEPRELEALVDDVRAPGATTVFVEPLVSGEVAETVAREADVMVAMRDPIEGLSEERLQAGEDYLSLMRTNLTAVREALGCR
jgi:ABC-type Zn uptake system ZnuABC Zn-binding protein ZnuA